MSSKLLITYVNNIAVTLNGLRERVIYHHHTGIWPMKQRENEEDEAVSKEDCYDNLLAR